MGCNLEGTFPVSKALSPNSSEAAMPVYVKGAKLYFGYLLLMFKEKHCTCTSMQNHPNMATLLDRCDAC